MTKRSKLSEADKNERFWCRVDKSGGEDACWPWLGPRFGGGYGQVYFHGRGQGAHRVAHLLGNGGLDSTLKVLHHCDNPPCCNPKHLFVGTAKDNSTDMVAKGRQRGRVNGFRKISIAMEVKEMVDEAVLIKVSEFERLCNLPATSGYKLVREEPALKKAVVRFGRRGIRLNKDMVLQWAKQQTAA